VAAFGVCTAGAVRPGVHGVHQQLVPREERDHQTGMLRQSLRLDGNQIQDAYDLRLDASLPKRDPRDRDPAVSGCK
jgi:hypothetical protein